MASIWNKTVLDCDVHSLFNLLLVELLDGADFVHDGRRVVEVCASGSGGKVVLVADGVRMQDAR